MLLASRGCRESALSRIHLVPIRPDEIDILVGVPPLVDDAVHRHQLIGNVVVVLVDDAVLTVPFGVLRIATDNDSLPRSRTGIRLIENEAIVPVFAVA